MRHPTGAPVASHPTPAPPPPPVDSILWPPPSLRIARRGAPWSISCDFDGTITQEDLVQAILDRYAGPKWREIEAEWEAGRIDARACLRRQTRLLRVSEAELSAFVDAAPLDPDAAGFFADCAGLNVDVRIVSDGYDWVIRRVMARLGVSDAPVFANRLSFGADGRCEVQFPYASPACEGGTCKCRVTDPVGPRLHIGDGRSDACLSDVADAVFAKGSLLASRQERGRASLAFSNFADIRVALPRILETEPGVFSLGEGAEAGSTPSRHDQKPQ